MRYASMLGIVLAARSLVAQQVAPAPAPAPAPPAEVGRAAELITTEEMARHVGALGADSMSARGTPSRGLDRAAQYVADQFSELGLATSLQQYPIPGSRRMSLSRSQLLFVAPAHKGGGAALLDERGSEMTKSAAVTFAGAARPGVDAVPEGGALAWGLGWFLGGATSKPTRMTILSGRHTAASIERADLRQEVVLYVPPAGIDSAAERQVIDQLRKSTSVIVLSDDDSAAFARRRQADTRPPVVVEGYIVGAMGAQRWVAYVRADVLQHFWRLAGIDLARARADTDPTIRQVPALTATLEVEPESTESNGPSGLNVIGVLPGTDSQFVNDYVVFSAHMDNGPNSRDDNAAGVAGLIALAKAFGQPGARPRRSLVFLATSGAADGHPGFGANFFAQWPTVGPPALNLTLDDIDRGPRDSVTIDGLGDADFATRPEWVAVNHPELGLVTADGGTISDPTLEHFAFVRRAVPTLSFHGTARHSGASAGSVPTAGDLGKAASVTRLAYFVGQELASATRRPRWSTLGRQYRLAALER